MRVLLVEDDQMLGGATRQGLTQDGFTVDLVSDGISAYSAVRTHDYQALLLDLGLPGLSGLELLHRLRAEGHQLPVLVITARGTLADRIKGLDAGADDFIVKPFDIEELVARIRAVTRRAAGRAASVIQHRGVAVDTVHRVAFLDGAPVSLTAREFATLCILLENKGRIISRQQLEEQLYGWGEEVESNAIEVHVYHLRRKLGRDFIQTVRRMGYTVPV
ncbi:MAG: response regulator [Betaproteobacteria bacterium]|nr:response regulator [Betaproteobacteria bacterium]MDE2047336.1 response regulator [Betaproteobacteria bacterium]